MKQYKNYLKIYFRSTKSFFLFCFRNGQLHTSVVIGIYILYINIIFDEQVAVNEEISNQPQFTSGRQQATKRVVSRNRAITRSKIMDNSYIFFDS